MAAVDTSEPNGLEVNFAAKPNDCSDFQKYAKEVYSFFYTTPTSNVPLYIEKMSSLAKRASGDSFDLYDKYVYGGVVLCMGQVAYPIDANHFYGDVKIFLTSGFGIVLHAPLGSVQMDAGREGLQYGDKTKQFIEQSVTNCIQAVLKDVEEQVSKAKSMWEAKSIVKAASMNYIANLLHNITWNGHSVHPLLFKTSDSIEHLTLRTYGRKRYEKYDTNEVSVGDVAFVIKDSTSSINEKCMELCNSKKYKSVYIIGDTTLANNNIDCPKDRVYLASSLPKPVITRGGHTKRKESVQEFDYTGYSSTTGRKESKFWKDSRVDLDVGGVYVNMSNYIVYNDKATMTSSEFKKYFEYIQRLCAEFKINMPVVCGVKNVVLDKVKKNAKWTTFWDFAKSVMARFVDEYCVSDALFAKDESEYFHSDKRFLLNLTLPEKSVAKEYADYVRKISNILSKVEGLTINIAMVKYLCDVCGFQISSTSMSPRAEKLSESVYIKYPLLKAFDTYTIDSHDLSKPVEEYILQNS
jgi:hypothetical protein